MLYKASTPIIASLTFSTTSFFIALTLLLINGKKAFKLNVLLRSPFAYLAAFQSWVFIQYISGISLDSTATLMTLLLGLGFLSFLISLTRVIHDQLHWLYISILVMATFQALYGVYNLISGAEKILWMPKEYYLGKATGTFVNPNHFAAYLNLAIGLLIAAFTSQKAHRHNHYRAGTNTLFSYLDQLYSLKSVAILVMVIGVLYSKSIGAIVSLALTLLLFPSVLAIIKKQPLGRAFLGALAPLGMVSLCFLMIDYSAFLSEQSNLIHTIERRWELSLASFSLMQDYWLTGSGAGTFYTVFPEYRNIEIGNAFYYHAHNDYIEFVSDFGIIGTALLGCFVFSALKRNITCITGKKSQWQAVFAYASIFVSLALAIHSLVDFPLRAPAYTLAYLSIISVNCISESTCYQKLNST